MAKVDNPFNLNYFLILIKVVMLHGRDSLHISICYMRQKCVSEVPYAKGTEN